MSSEKKQSSTDDFIGELSQVVGQTGEGRGRYYGHPADNHGTTAEMWSSYLTRRFDRPIQLSARDVCMMNAAQKISRDANRPKRDNLLDLAGYAENADRIARRDDGGIDDRVSDEIRRDWQGCDNESCPCNVCESCSKGPISRVLNPNAQDGQS